MTRDGDGFLRARGVVDAPDAPPAEDVIRHGRGDHGACDRCLCASANQSMQELETENALMRSILCKLADGGAHTSDGLLVRSTRWPIPLTVDEAALFDALNPVAELWRAIRSPTPEGETYA